MKYQWSMILMISLLAALVAACSAAGPTQEAMPAASANPSPSLIPLPTQAALPTAEPTSPPVIATLPQQPPTAEHGLATPTAAEAQQPVASQATAAPAAQASIPLTDWQKTAFVSLNSGCKVAATTCYRGGQLTDNPVAKMVLISGKGLAVDPAWKNPILIFWHKYQGDQPVSVDVSDGGSWSRLKSFQGGSSGWVQSTVDLNLFKGKTILIQFSSPAYSKTVKKGNQLGVPKTVMDDWWINNIQIVPNYDSSQKY